MTPTYRLISTAAAICMTLVAAAAPLMAQSASSGMVTVTGQISYPQRIALPADSVATVRISDVSLADAAAPVLAETSISGRQVPIPFRLSVAANRMTPQNSYNLSATIRDAQGNLRWTTDTAVAIDTARTDIDVGTVTLVQVTTDSTDGAPLSDRIAGDWRIEDINDRGVMDIAQTVLTFSAGNMLSGSGGCNRFSASYTLAGDMLEVGPIASTQMACTPALANQEQAFFAVLDAPLRVEITETGALILRDTEGQSLTARR